MTLFQLRPVGTAPHLEPFGEGTFVLGADPACDRMIVAEGVSRRHARLTVRHDGARLEDLGSKNGTRVGGVAIREAKLEDGDEVSLGHTRYRVDRRAPEPLAFELHNSSQRAPTRTIALADGPLVWWPGLIASFFSSLDEPSRALEELREGLGAAAIWYLELRGGEVVLLCGAGPRPDLPAALVEAVSARLTHEAGVMERGLAGGELTFAILGCGDHARGVLITGPRSAAGPALAEIVLHGLESRQPRPTRVRRPEAPLPFPPGLLSCPSPAMRALYAEVRRYASGRLPVLVEGETGTGKEHVARLLHAWSERRGRPFVAVNCAAIPRELLEAELFGVERGAATGVSARPGLLLEASGGVLLLDEIAELSPAAQASLLRVLQEREVVPVGGQQPRAVDVRVIAATNVGLADRVAAGGFRADLYYRVAAITLRVPPLRERAEDIGPLCEHLVRQLSGELGRPVRGMTLGALRALEASDWPGNVRELSNVVARMVYAVDSTGILDVQHLPRAPVQAPPASSAPADDDLDLERRLGALEKALVMQALERSGGNRSQAARLLGLSRNGLRAKLSRHGLGEEDLDDG
jgi:DNA-binding NtrC family response regulator